MIPAPGNESGIGLSVGMGSSSEHTTSGESGGKGFFLNKKVFPKRKSFLSLPAFAFFSASKNMDIRPRNEMKIKQFAKNCGAENQNELEPRNILWLTCQPPTSF